MEEMETEQETRDRIYRRDLKVKCERCTGTKISTRTYPDGTIIRWFTRVRRGSKRDCGNSACKIKKVKYDG